MGIGLKDAKGSISLFQDLAFQIMEKVTPCSRLVDGYFVVVSLSFVIKRVDVEDGISACDLDVSSQELVIC